MFLKLIYFENYKSEAKAFYLEHNLSKINETSGTKNITAAEKHEAIANKYRPERWSSKTPQNSPPKQGTNPQEIAFVIACMLATRFPSEFKDRSRPTVAAWYKIALLANGNASPDQL